MTAGLPGSDTPPVERGEPDAARSWAVRGAAGGDGWDHGLRGLLSTAAARPAPVETRTYSVFQLMPADLAHGVLAVGRVAHGFADEAAASAHALCLGWRGFAVLPSRHMPRALSAEVPQDGL